MRGSALQQPPVTRSNKMAAAQPGYNPLPFPRRPQMARNLATLAPVSSFPYGKRCVCGEQQAPGRGAAGIRGGETKAFPVGERSGGRRRRQEQEHSPPQGGMGAFRCSCSCCYRYRHQARNKPKQGGALLQQRQPRATCEGLARKPRRLPFPSPLSRSVSHLRLT